MSPLLSHLIPRGLARGTESWKQGGGLICLRFSRKLTAKNAKVARPTLFNYIYTREEYEKYADEIFRLMTEAKFDVRVHKTYPLKDVAQAHQVSHASFVTSVDVAC